MDNLSLPFAGAFDFLRDLSTGTGSIVTSALPPHSTCGEAQYAVPYGVEKHIRSHVPKINVRWIPKLRWGGAPIMCTGYEECETAFPV